MASPRVNVRLDPELRQAIIAYGRDNGLTTSQTIRELLRQAVRRPPEPVTRGWREGFAQGHADYQRRMFEGAKELRESQEWMTGGKKSR